MEATRAKEFIHFGVVPFNTIKDGRAYFFVAVDAYSKFAFNLGVDKNLNDDILLKYVSVLLQDHDFKKIDTAFTLVMPMGENLKQFINVLIQPSGQVIFNEELVLQEIMPLVSDIFQ